MKVLVVIVALFSALCSVHAMATQLTVAECKVINKHAAAGDRLYKTGEYQQARREYLAQVAWAEGCYIDTKRLATAYNNVALTYFHQQDYLKGAVWLALRPEDSKSKYNYSQYRDQIVAAEKQARQSITGTYWQYARLSIWNTITVRQAKNGHYIADFDGYYVGANALRYGPNMGQFSADLTVKNGHAYYKMDPEEQGDCSYEFTFGDNRIELKQTAGEILDCGFGMNVIAEGTFHKVDEKISNNGE